MRLFRVWRDDWTAGSLILIFAGLLLALCSFCSFGGLQGIGLSIATALAYVTGYRLSTQRPRDLFLSGLVFHVAAIYWLAATLSLFGGFPTPVSWLLFALFAILSSLQFFLVGWVAQRLDRGAFARWSLAFPLAWAAGEFLVPRLFPWSFVHALISWKSFSGLAELCGEAPLSALFLWWAALVTSRGTPPKPRIFALVGTLALVFLFGAWRERDLGAALASAPALRVALVQGNLSTKQKGDVRYLEANLDRYRELTKSAADAGAELVVWPESVMNAWTPETLQAVRGTTLDPNPGGTVPLLYGTLSARRGPERDEQGNQKISKFNTAVGLDGNGAVLGMYHKKVLMPFGEYLPLASRFPAIKKLSPYSGDFTVGDRDEVIPFSHAAGRYSVWALICYEDLVPSLTREGVSHGADLLINLTNDAWYGNTEAPYQHHLLASWRAIETRRFLLRSTNTGLTAVVSPFGETAGTLPLFQEGVLTSEVRLLTAVTPYEKIGDTISWLLVAIVAVGLLRRRT